MDASAPRLPIGRSGRLDAMGLTGPDGDHALLILDAEEPRALLFGRVAGGSEQLVVSGIGRPLEIGSDGDALASWLASASLAGPRERERVPAWASLVGLVLLLALAAFAVIGGAVVFGWLLEALGA